MNRAIGIVGSRRRNTLHDRKIVFKLVEWLLSGELECGRPLQLVSGGCPKGADAFAEEAAKIFAGVEIEVVPVDKEGVSSRWEFRTRAFARNRVIAEKSRILFALVHPDRKGGTENTIEHALELKVPVYLVHADGTVYLSQDGDYPKCAPVVSLLG
jgi:hypothetical protein